jgi:hypothetical protein
LGLPTTDLEDYGEHGWVEARARGLSADKEKALSQDTPHIPRPVAELPVSNAQVRVTNVVNFPNFRLPSAEGGTLPRWFCLVMQCP